MQHDGCVSETGDLAARHAAASDRLTDAIRGDANQVVGL
jgi:hypothetical protein